MGYNLISVLKQIAANIGSVVVPDPNTQLSNIKTAIENINIQAIATDSIAVDGSRWNPAGNYVADLNLFWEGIGHVNTSTLNHPQDSGNGIVIAARNGAGAVQVYIPAYAYSSGEDQAFYIRFTQYANLGNWVNPWEEIVYASNYVSYRDTNNLGATDVQGAIDKLSGYSEGTATINTTYLAGTVNWQKLGSVVSVALEVSTVANLPSSNWEVALISNLPPVLCPMSWIRRWTLPSTDNTKKPLILGASSNPGVPRTILYSWGNGGVASGTPYSASFMYISK